MKYIAAFIVAIVVLAAAPTVASANTGSVKCDSTGVVFTYNANFEHDTWVSEKVGNALRVVRVRAHTASSDTWEGVTGTVLVSATWSGGHIGPVTLICPSSTSPPPPPPTTTPPPPGTVAPPVCPPNTVNEGMSNGVLVCVRTVTTPAPPPAPAPVTNVVTVPATKALKCPKGTKLYRKFGNRIICTKRKVKVVVKWRTAEKTTPRKSIHGAGGVTG